MSSPRLFEFDAGAGDRHQVIFDGAWHGCENLYGGLRHNPHRMSLIGLLLDAAKNGETEFGPYAITELYHGDGKPLVDPNKHDGCPNDD